MNKKLLLIAALVIVFSAAALFLVAAPNSVSNTPRDQFVRQRGGRFTVRDRDPDDLTPGLRQFMNLPQSRNGVPGISGCHRLHDDRVLTADFHIADMKHAGGPPRRDQGHS